MTDGRPRLVFVSPRFLYPADSGGKIRTTQVLRGLKGGAFAITLVMPASAADRQRFAAEIDSICDEHLYWEPRAKTTVGAALSRVALLAHRFPVPVAADRDSRGAATVLRALASRPDVVVFDFPHSAVLAPPHFDVPSVMFTHNVEAEIFERHVGVARFPLNLVWQSQFRKMERFERDTLGRFDMVVAVSERDSDFFRERYGIGNCGSIPTGVDTEFFGWQAPGDAPQVVFCGSMDWMANIDGVNWFADEVWPRVREQVPEARMTVVGRTPPEAMVRRIRGKAPEWTFTGFVDDVRDHVGGAAAFVIPLRVGGGTRIKAFEAMAMGTPVVSTAIGIEGLPVVGGEHCLIADDAGKFAENIVRLLGSAELRGRMSRRARELVESHYDYRVAARAFEEHCLCTIGLAPGKISGDAD